MVTWILILVQGDKQVCKNSFIKVYNNSSLFIFYK